MSYSIEICRDQISLKLDDHVKLSPLYKKDGVEDDLGSNLWQVFCHKFLIHFLSCATVYPQYLINIPSLQLLRANLSKKLSVLSPEELRDFVCCKVFTYTDNQVPPQDPGPYPQALIIETYTPPDPGPYPQDQPKQNSVRFTPTQVEAIISGIQPGLIMVVGPPGTGKIDQQNVIRN
ncbi:hypothetical protein JHK82_024324 [Glycine max]|nr:hypothetical protein JHK85_024907 [Glycine max]KAG5012155.1 hypothetical protein JHK86_024416 [Glycine max]KAG5133136.1 hypothetical protein JHK82_024324 [Glycine max]